MQPSLEMLDVKEKIMNITYEGNQNGFHNFSTIIESEIVSPFRCVYRTDTKRGAIDRARNWFHQVLKDEEKITFVNQY